MDKNFIVTTDSETANLLKNEGFQLIGFSEGKWTFINVPNKMMNFSNKQKVTYTNTLYM